MMKRYKVVVCKIKEAEGLMNELAAEGWCVISTIPNIALGYGMIITLERE